MRTALLFLSAVFFISVCKGADEKVSAKAEITHVTVYRLGAEIIEHFTASVHSNTRFIEVSNISSSLEKNSLQLKTDNVVTLLGFEFSNIYVQPETKSTAYQLLEDTLHKITKSIARLTAQSSTINDLLNILNSNKDIKGSQTGVSVEELTRLINYYRAKSLELKKELDELSDKIVDLNETKELIENQLKEEEKKNTAKGGKLVLQVACNLPGTYEFTITYLTQNASWIPFYDIKAKNTSSPFDLIYKARILQTTGIDWNKVKLDLSTALPDQYGNAPILKTWFLQYAEPILKLRGSSSLMKDKFINDSVASLNEVVVTGYGVSTEQRKYNPPSEPIYIINGTEVSKETFKNITPQAIKSLNVIKGSNATEIYGIRAGAGAIIITLKDELSDYTTVENNIVSTVYHVDIPLDIATNGKDQVAILQTQSVNADYTFLSVPKLSDQVFLMARVADWGKLNLLDGEANLFFENTFVGKTNIETATTGDTLNLSIATDKRILVSRTKLKDFSSTQFLSGYKKQVFTYEISAKNNKNQAIMLDLSDQYPISSNKEIEVVLTESTNASVNPETGELNWKLVLKPGEQQKIRFQYSVKYPKDKTINL